jgi:hypothetical protein
MKSELEKFITANRAGFDANKPGSRVWDGITESIDAAVPSKFTIGHRRGWISAACIIGLVCCTVLVWERSGTQRKDTLDSKRNTEILENMPEEYAIQIKQVSKEIEKKEAELKKYAGTDSLRYKRIVAAYKLFDSSYRNLQREVKNLPGNIKVIDALIDNLQTKKQLLSQELLEMKLLEME